MLKILLSIGVLQLTTMCVLLLRTKVLALLLGPEQYGLMGVVDRAVAVFAQTASLSLPFAALRYLSPLWHTDRAQYFSLLSRMRNVLVGLVLVALGVGMVLVFWFPDALGAQVDANRTLMMVALLSMPTLTLVPFLQNALAASFSHSRAMVFTLAHAVVFTSTAVLGVWLMGLSGFYALYSVAGGVFCVAILIAFRRLGQQTPQPDEPVRHRYYLPNQVWRFGLVLFAPAFLAPYVAYAVFDYVIADSGRQAGGLMQSAMGLALAVRGVLGAAGQVFLAPLVNREGSFEERVRRSDDFQKVLFLLVGVVVPPLILFSDVALSVLYSSEFAPAAPYVVIFVAVEVLGMAVGNYQAVLLAMDYVGVSVLQNIVAQGVMFVVAVLTIPHWGVAGAGLAALSNQVVLGIGTAGFFAYRFGFRPSVRVTALSAYVFGAFAVAAWIASGRHGLSWSRIALEAGVYAVLVAGLALFPDRQDWANIRRLVDGLLSRIRGSSRVPRTSEDQR